MNDIAHSENKFGGLLVSRRTLTKLSQAHALVGNLRSLFLLRALEGSLVNVQPRESCSVYAVRYDAKERFVVLRGSKASTLPRPFCASARDQVPRLLASSQSVVWRSSLLRDQSKLEIR